jgi:hypothetical protein
MMDYSQTLLQEPSIDIVLQGRYGGLVKEAAFKATIVIGKSSKRCTKIESGSPTSHEVVNTVRSYQIDYIRAMNLFFIFTREVELTVWPASCKKHDK